MLEALRDGKWEIKFKVEALSPTGFRYSADGETGEEAFLRAFGQWRRELFAAPPKVPVTLAKPVVPKPPPSEAPAVLAIPNPKDSPRRRLKLSLLDAWLKEQRPYQRHLKPPSANHKRNQTRMYQRLYMQAYRERKRLVAA